MKKVTANFHLSLIPYLCIVVGFLLISGCSTEQKQTEQASQSVAENPDNKQAVSSSAASIDLSDLTSWQGTALGNTSDLQPDLVKTSFIVLLGAVMADAAFYKNIVDRHGNLSYSKYPEQETKLWSDALPNAISNATLARFNAIKTQIDSDIAERIEQRLLDLNSDSTISLLLGETEQNKQLFREKRKLAQNVVRLFNPIVEPAQFSRQDYVDAISVLWRKAGDAMAKGVSQDGIAKDLAEIERALAFNRVVNELRPRWVSFCDAQRDINQQVRDAVALMSEKAYAQNLGDQLEVTPADFYQLASAMQSMAANLPSNDEDICQ